MEEGQLSRQQRREERLERLQETESTKRGTGDNKGGEKAELEVSGLGSLTVMPLQDRTQAEVEEGEMGWGRKSQDNDEFCYRHADLKRGASLRVGPSENQTESPEAQEGDLTGGSKVGG